ncbi:MazG family protein [Nostocoides sp. HKS02]|uniref:MazG family protein n=1 Tax=Nostocoides sp. HKS02 TaxID=1813880 RepID=UPI0012B4D030|nr:MazG family protein [Tetrasphaera sp. HKS02]QGN59156.1 MazG family protein [Tetrasphaera sp. HKS02]
MPGRLTLLIGSPRIAPGLLTRAAWRTLEDADALLARDPDEPLAEALVEAGMPVTHLGAVAPPELARTLVGDAASRTVVWVGSADGDPGLTDAVASEVSRLPEPPEVEVLVGSWDVPGSRLLDLVAVMDRLRSPGGCPWDAEQTQESLVKYLLEEAHEAAEAIESGDRDHIREELGDVLLQVAFQSRVAQEHPAQPFDIDDVAGGIVDKLVRRHPHVFADADASSPEEVERAWEQIKAQERAAKAGHTGGEAGHESLLHGIPRSLPSLLAAEKVLARWERTGGDLAGLVAPPDLRRARLRLRPRPRHAGPRRPRVPTGCVRRGPAPTGGSRLRRA